MSRKKSDTIAIVITGLAFGGAERVTSYLANYFVSQGRNVHLISLTTGEHAYPLSEKITITEYDISPSLPVVFRYLSLIRNIRRTLKTIRPRVVLGMMSYSGSLACIANLGLGTPFIISERNDPYTSKGFSEFEKKILRFVYRTFVTKGVFQSKGALSYYYAETDPRGIVIPNPLFTESMPLPNTNSIGLETIVSAGRLNFQKNFSLLIQAFHKVHSLHPSSRLVIYGEGEQRVELESLVRSLGLEQAVSLPGIEKDIFSRFLEAGMFVLSSNFEGMPNALIEAMAMGLPCITTDYSQGRGTVIVDGENGLVVPRNDVDALANAMLSLIENPALAEELGREAVRIREVLDSTSVCKQWLSVIESTTV
nr:glycosyltransferase family 4 protein [uncultured Sphaerochaeta sp.]